VRVRIVTDSTADLPPDLARAHRIHIVPLTVIFGQETFRDGVDLDADTFYQRLTGGGPLPTTSQPSVQAFLQVYREVAPGAEGVLSLHISSHLSGTWNSACQARDAYTDAPCPIRVVDTLQASIGLGMVVLSAARTALEGGGLEEAEASARRAMERVEFFGLVDTLEYLHRGGRIGRAQAFLGSLLHVKPLLTIREGITHPLERVRSRQKGIQRILERAQRLAPLEEAGVAHSTTPEEAQALAEALQPLCARPVWIARFGPVVGTYLGPGALGVALLPA